MRSRCLCAALVALLVGLLATVSSDPASAEYAQIEGSGSTWASLLVQQWIADVSTEGLEATFNNNGSSQGRKDFASGVTDFGVTDVPYQGVDPVTHQADMSSRPYTYVPLTGGGVALTYHLEVDGKLVDDLRLSGATIAKIFTNQITDWDDPAISADNNGRVLPSLPTTPVVRSDSNGATWQLTNWFEHAYPSIWESYDGGVSGATSLYPREGSQIAANGDDGVMNTVSSAAGDGTIGYVDYTYPLSAHYPVVSVENASGSYVQPTAVNVDVALSHATITGCDDSGACSPDGVPTYDYLTADLSGVYADEDPRSYPISGYSYAIIPASSTDQRMTVGKRQALVDFLSYSLCTGQQSSGPYGFAPLPKNLVQVGFEQLQKLGPDADGGPVAGVTVPDPQTGVASCDDPGFDLGSPPDTSQPPGAPGSPGGATTPPTCPGTGESHCTIGVLVNTARPGIVGTGRVGSTLRATPGAWQGASSLAYQWLRDGSPVAGATSSTYEPRAGDLRHTIAIRVTARGTGRTTTAVSTAVTIATGRLTLTHIRIRGPLIVGQLVSVRLRNPDGARLRYRWFAGGDRIRGARFSSWTLQPAQRHERLVVQVTATKAGYATLHKRSPRTRPVRGA